MKEKNLPPNHLLIESLFIIKILASIAIFIIVASFAGQLIKYLTKYDSLNGIIPLFFLGGETNIPTYYSSLLLLLSALILLIICLMERKRKSSWSRWAILSFIFLYISIDEVSMLHERLISPVRSLLGNDQFGIFYFAWVLPAFILIFILAIFLYKFFIKLNAKIKLNFLIAAILYVGGALGFELLGGRYCELYGRNNLTYSMLQNVEETMEFAGTIVFIWGLLGYISDKFETIHIRFIRDNKQSLNSNN